MGWFSPHDELQSHFNLQGGWDWLLSAPRFQRLWRRQRNEERDPSGSCWVKNIPNIPAPGGFHPHWHNEGFQMKRESLGTLGLERPPGIWDLGASQCWHVPFLQFQSPSSFHLLLPTFPPFPAQFPSHNDSSPALCTPDKSQENSSVFHICHAPPGKQIQVGLSRWNQLRGSGTGWNKSSNVFIRLFPGSSGLFRLIGARDEGARSRLGFDSRR